MANKHCLKLILEGDPASLQPAQAKILKALLESDPDSLRTSLAGVLKFTVGENGQMATSLVGRFVLETHKAATQAFCHKIAMDLEGAATDVTPDDLKAYLEKKLKALAKIEE